MTSPKLALAAALAAATLFTGCASKPAPQPLTPQAFSPRPSPAPAPAAQPANPLVASQAPVADVVANEIKPVRPAPAPTAIRTTPAASTLPAIGKSTGQYLTLGGVVAEVNSTPIYASKVISLLDRPLRERAKTLDANAYRRAATDDINRQIRELVAIEVEVAAAQRNLDDDERKQADLQTMIWRMQQITKAGGSIELAKRRVRYDEDGHDTGLTFEEVIEEQRRAYLVQLYYQKRVYPRIQVAAADIREYYDKNVSTEFTENEKVKFILLKVDPAKTGSKDLAITKVNEKLKRAKAGEDFAKMCTEENDERMFAGKDPIETAPASFSIPKVREVLKTLRPGQVSDIIEDRGAFYLVRVEARQEGIVHAFDEQKVQDMIRLKLRTTQLRTLREQERVKLARTALITMDQDRVNIAIEMAMQKYVQYAAAK